MGQIDLFPLKLSFEVAGCATLLGIVVGFPLVWILSQLKSPWKNTLESCFMLPMVLPPTVLGYYLLVALGRQSVIGQFFESIGLPLVFTIRGAIIAATVVSIPFFIKTGLTAIESVPQNVIEAGRVLGHSEFNVLLKIIIPLAWRGLVSGIILMFARGLGDFGTTLMVAGSIPHETTTMPIAIYNTMLAGEPGKTNLLVIIMTLAAFFILFVLNGLSHRFIRQHDLTN